jgi:hypothetical protein
MNKTRLATLVALTCYAGVAAAEVTINGFASIKAGMASNGDTLYGYTDDIDFKNESLFAVQVQSDLGEKLSVTAQLLARGVNDFDAEFEWAFLTYQINENWRLNAGRLRTPFYKYSDFRDVGYAYDWLRTPQSVYDLGFNTIEGLSLYHSTSLGDIQSNLQFVFGAYDGDARVLGTQAPAQINQITGISWELSQDWIAFRLAYLIGDVSIQSSQLSTLTNTLTTLGLTQIAKDIDFDKDQGSFLGLGLNIDRNDWLLVTEYTHVEVKDSFYADQDSYYVSLGHRFGSYTPYVSFEKDDDAAKPEIYARLPAQLPPQLTGGVKGLVDSQFFDNNTWNLGLRYDFHPSAAFKVQYSWAEDQTTKRKDNLMALGVDLVF